MWSAIIVIVPMLLLIGYVKLQGGKGYPFSTRKGKQQTAIVAFLLLMVAATGIWYAFAEQQTKSGQYIQLLILFGGAIAVLIAIGIASLRDKLDHKDKNHPNPKRVKDK